MTRQAGSPIGAPGRPGNRDTAGVMSSSSRVGYGKALARQLTLALGRLVDA